MPDDYQQSPRIKRVKGDAIYNYYEVPPPKSSGPRRWAWIAAATATLAIAGTLLTTSLNAQSVYYCASRNEVKYHTDATCLALQQCGAKIKSIAIGRAKARMELCKVCH